VTDSDSSDLVRDLLRPEAYGDAGRSPVSLRTTHASWVFLTGDSVWKVKRPVSFRFLDFRTVEARRQACEDEVRLNRRLAPDVYLGVDPIHRTAHGHAIAGEGPVVDWAVHMRRLPDSASAEALLARGELDAAALAEVAERLASFFADAGAAPQFGSVAALSRNVAENFAEVAPFVGDLLDRETFEEVQTFQTRALAERTEQFVARLAAGRIREGHGDLRLEHVYLLPGPDGRRQTVIIDCIEFNQRFRCGDTAAEVAFLAMELEAAGRPALAAGFLARSAEASDDFGLYGVLDFYLSYRAWIRGKVAAFVAADPTTPRDVRSQKRAEAARDFRLARSFGGKPLDRPFLIVVGGVIGSGKSVLASALGQELAVPIISSDRTRKLRAGLRPTDRADAALYDQDQREQTYVELLRRAAGVLGAGRGVILDATFSAHRWRHAAAETARAANADFAFIEAACPNRELLRARLAARRKGESVSDATDELLEEFLRHYEPPGPADPGPRFSVDTGDSRETALWDARHQLESIGIVPPAERRGL
jgi:aminoglycoside phosphotransferase family enzyme/predicted kinase